MRTFAFVMSACLIASAVKADDKTNDARAIVDRAIQAHGAEKMAKVKAETWKTKGSFLAMGNPWPYTGEYTFVHPDKMRFDFHMGSGDQKMEMTMVLDGQKGWESGGGQLADLTKKKAEEFQHKAYTMSLIRLLPLRDKAYTLTSLGDSKVRDQDFVGVKVAREGHRDVSLFFDKKTGLLAKMSTKAFDELDGADVTEDSIFTSYSDKDGVKMFKTLTLQHDGKDYFKEEVLSHQIIEKPDLKAFAKPPEKAAESKPAEKSKTE
ncbi:MAG: hypothetical protein ACJ8C4_12270 [Gemmataceae bacterium]